LSTTTTESLLNEPSLLPVLWAGMACGILDIAAAVIVNGFFGIKPIRLLQGIASGLLGPQAFEGGLASALLGLLCHFFIAFTAAAVYFAASHFMHFLVHHSVVSGVLYGVAVYFFMNRIVLPLSAASKRPFSIKMMVIGMLIHMVCVGLPISLIVRRFSR